jgi:hypothetical protein
MHHVLVIDPIELQWISFIKMPDLIGSDPVPAPVLALGKQKVNRC